MFGSIRRENARLRSLAETRRQQAVTATDLRETALGNQARIAKRFSAQHDELTRLRAERGDADRLRLAWKSARRRTMHLTEQLADRDRLILDQQKTLDCLLGLDSAAVEAGADWQDRRTDRPGGVR